MADVSRIMALNDDALVNYVIPLIAQMGDQAHGGLIAHTNSLAGLMGIPRQGPYSAAKAAARTLIGQHRAARHVIRAPEREPAQAYFPWATTALVRTLSVLPASVSSAALRGLASR